MEIEAEKRTIFGKKNKILRKNGKIPAGVYGKEIKPMPLTINKSDFIKIFKEAGYTSLVDLKIKEGKKIKVLIQEVQRDPISKDYIHVSFQQIDTKKPITVTVPLTLTNEEQSKAVKEQGGVVIQPTAEIEIRCTPLNIPSEIIVDVSNLSIGDSMKVKDIKLPKNINLLREEDKELVVAVATTPTEEHEEKPEEVEGTPTEGLTAPEETTYEEQPSGETSKGKTPQEAREEEKK